MSIRKSKRKRENQSQLSSKTEINWAEWNSATSTKNFMMDDTFLDYVKYDKKSVTKQYPELIRSSTKQANNPTSFVRNIMDLGIEFEDKVIQLLMGDMNPKNIINIHGDVNARSLICYNNTIKAMNDGIPFIYQGVVRNYKNKTYGVPDLIIRSDWLNRFLENDVYTSAEMKVAASGLKSKLVKFRKKSRRVKPKYHYVIVDVKYKTLSLRSDGKHLRNDGNIKAYKSQLLIYTDALEQMQGYNPGCAFILGSKWKYESCGIKHEGNTCFGTMGKIDYKKLDISYIKKTKDALKWLNLVKKEGHKWDLTQRPLPRPELYPNMCNQMDFPYHHVKAKFAEDVDEISLLWYIGPNERRNAHKVGVYTWKDPKCTPEVLGMKGQKRPIVLNRILETNRNSIHTIRPKYFEKNLGDWKQTKSIELFVDFEMNNCVFQDFGGLPNFDNKTRIFMIGAGYIDPVSNVWVYKQFTVDKINANNEKKICSDFLYFVEVLKRKYKVSNIPVYHWSKAEVSCWNRAADRYQHTVSLLFSNIEWVDLHLIFQGEPVGIKGCLNYSLKTIAKVFHKNNFIKTIWNQDSSCVNGADAAVEAYKIQQECEAKNIIFTDHPQTEDIIKYNEVDCKVLQEMLYYIRKHHINPEEILNPVIESKEVVVENKEIFGRSRRKRRKINYRESRR